MLSYYDDCYDGDDCFVGMMTDVLMSVVYDVMMTVTMMRSVVGIVVMSVMRMMMMITVVLL